MIFLAEKTDKLQTSLRRKPICIALISARLFWFAQRLQVDSQLLAFLVKVAALQPERPRNVRHVEIVAPNFREHHFPFERFGAFRQRTR